jgi:adenylate cyclase
MHRPEQHPTPGALRHRSSGGIRTRYLLGLLSSYVAASTDVIVVLRLLAGSRVHVVAAVTIALAGAAIAIGAGVATLSSTLTWYRVGACPTPAQRTRALSLPWRNTCLHGAIWAAVGTATLAVHHDAGARVLILIGTSMVLGGAATCCMGYLLAERILRPVLAAALTEDVHPRLRRHGVGVRLHVAWALCTAIPLVGIAAIVVSARIGWPIQAGADISTPVLFLTGVSVVTGLRGMTLAARSVAEPLREVTEAMGRVKAGQYNIRTLVYDGSEIGVLQSGFNDMAAGIAERELLRDLFGRHVGRDVAQNALRNGTAFTGNVCQAGVVFVDLAGSTRLAADNPPDRVAAVLNAFFHIVVDVIDNHGGYVNKFEGDAALAIFGAPLSCWCRGAPRFPRGRSR